MKYLAQGCEREGLPIWFGWWLMLLFVMVLLMMQIGAITRLTDSGLSMVEWRPLVGSIPPLSDEEWQRVFSLYRQTAEYLAYQPDLEGFKQIFWWEYFHRLWGRLLGIVAILPFVFLLWKRALNSWWIGRLSLVIVLGGVQGVVGYWMVISGFGDRLDVAPERLLVHLSLASVILIYLSLLLRRIYFPSLRNNAQAISFTSRFFVYLTTVWIILLSSSGVVVAGLDAGLVYNNWPLMDDNFITSDYGKQASSTWELIFHDVASVQTHHRIAAYIGFSLVVLQFIMLVGCDSERLKILSLALLLLIVCQGALGIITLLSVVSVAWALLHQLGAILLLICSVLMFTELNDINRGYTSK